VSYYATLQELPSIKPDCIPIVRDIIEAARRKVALGHPEGFEVELSRFTVEDDGDIHPDEWYDSWQEEEKWIRVLAPYMKYGYILFRGDESDWGYVIEDGKAYHTLIIYQKAAPVDEE
jgi:hypothetical protein